MSETTLGALLERAAASPKGVRFLDDGVRGRFLSYADLLERARRTGAALASLGVRPGDRVGIVLPTGPGFYDAFFGASLIGAVPAPLYPPVRLGRLPEYRERTSRMLRGCGARIVVTDRLIARVIGRAVADAAPPLGLVALHDLAPHRAATGGVLHAADPESVALIQHSSGTTGRPRPVRLTHRAVIANIDAIRGRLETAHPAPRDAHAAVSWLPLYHDMGLIGCVITAMAHPVDLTLIRPERFIARPAVWLRAVSTFRATVSGAPDFAYSYAADRVSDEEMDGVDLSSWLVALNGAEPVTSSAMERFAARFEPCGFRREAFTPVYGLTEATLAVTFSDPAERYRTATLGRNALVRDGVVRVRGADGGGARAVGPGPDPDEATIVSVGKPLAGVDLRIAGPGDETALPEGSMGRVLVGGASLFSGYDDEEEADRPAPDRPAAGGGPWLDTGDTGFMLAGELYLYSRARDVIVLRGSKYAPQDIEHAVAHLDAVRAGCVAAIGVPETPGGAEGLVLLAERARGRRAEDDPALIDAARKAIVAGIGVECRRVVVLEPGTLPRTSSGKIRRAEARRLFLVDGLAAPRRAGAATVLEETVRSAVALARMRRRPSDPRGPSDPSA